MEEDFNLTVTQLKSIKSVERAMQKAGKLGVEFWDNYGTLTAYNANKITLPVPDMGKEFSLQDYEDAVEELKVLNFFAGNADDELRFDKIS